MSLRSMRQFATLPTLPKHGPMPPMVSVIIPIARTNLVINPSPQLATTGYTALGGSIAQSTAQQYHGTYSLAVTPAGGGSGAYYSTVSLTAGTIYAYSCKWLGVAGLSYRLAIDDNAGSADLTSVTFIATGRWQWIYGYYKEVSTTTRRIYFYHQNTVNNGVFYLDGVQVEAIAAGETVSTYIDGNQLGLLVGQQPPPYLWNGTPYASTSSRSALTRAGGYLVNLEDAYNFLLTGLIGLGMAVPNNVSIPYTVLDGARYLRTTKPPRTISLPGRFQADTIFDLDRNLSAMRAAFDRDLTGIQQPMVLQVEPRDECGNVIGDFAQIQCLYAGGLEGNDTNLPLQDAAPTFTMYVPYLIGGAAGTALTVQQTVTNANDILQRTPAGVWQALSTGMNGTVNALAYGPDGRLYAGGTFTTAGGGSAKRIAVWDGSAWAALGNGFDSDVLTLAFDPAGNLYAGGFFVKDGSSVTTFNGIAKWNGTTWSAVGTTGVAGGGAKVYRIAIDSAGLVYLSGDFTSAGGTSAASIASWNGSAYAALGTGASGTPVAALAIGIDGTTLYAGGNFATMGGVANTVAIAKWNGSAWSALSTGLNAQAGDIAIGADGSVYPVGQFATAGGVTTAKAARWNGTGWFPLGSGLNNNAYASFFFNGSLYVGGDFTAAGGITVPDGGARWNGSTWLPLDVDLPGTARVTAIRPAPDGTLTLGFGTTGSAVSAANTTATNVTSSLVYPVIRINGPTSGTSRIYQIINYTTGIGVWLNLTLNVGEVATLDFNPQAPSFTTTFQGDITSKILPGSQPSLFYLAQGANTISFFAASSTVVATMAWQKHYNGGADLVN